MNIKDIIKNSINNTVIGKQPKENILANTAAGGESNQNSIMEIIDQINECGVEESQNETQSLNASQLNISNLERVKQNLLNEER